MDMMEPPGSCLLHPCSVVCYVSLSPVLPSKRLVGDVGCDSVWTLLATSLYSCAPLSGHTNGHFSPSLVCEQRPMTIVLGGLILSLGVCKMMVFRSFQFLLCLMR